MRPDRQAALNQACIIVALVLVLSVALAIMRMVVSDWVALGILAAGIVGSWAGYALLRRRRPARHPDDA